MENERDQQDVLMALQGMGRMSLMMDPVFKLTATGTILLIQHFARMHKEGMLNRREFQNFQEFAKLTEGNYQIVNVPVESWKELEKSGFLSQMEERNVRYIVTPFAGVWIEIRRDFRIIGSIKSLPSRECGGICGGRAAGRCR